MTNTTTPPALTREEILAHPWMKTKSVKAFGGTVYIKQLSMNELSAVTGKLLKMGDDQTSLDVAKVLLLDALCNEHGKPLFDDLDSLGTLDPKELTKLYHIAEDMNKLSDDEVVEAGKG